MRRKAKIIFGVVSVIVLLGFMLWSCFIIGILATTHEDIIRIQLPQIQQALDLQCRGSGIIATRDGFDYDPVMVWETSQTQNGWQAECFSDQYDDAFRKGNWYCTCLKPFDEDSE